MIRIIAALALACVLTACQTVSNPAAWGQIAAGTAAIVGETKIDPQIERISKKLAAYCADVQTAAIAVDILAPEKIQKAAVEAKILVATVCAAPPSNVASAITSLAAAYGSIDAARKGA
ncbi:MAG TPA: hypothetical protein VGN82_14140 [Bosea sp. (in: a-proteobacteria)]|jgi:hypothetical protein|uniref:hypothetical protein n=1 Tax=Bosea sp. (in: a-proteobacteria) TaxID=1871050 RepID=UPI002E1034E5|nr:hypothetical protein [Bosea sp. (in: a-proteobacteria)]